MRHRFLRFAYIALAGLGALIFEAVLSPYHGYAGDSSPGLSAYASKVSRYSPFYSKVFGREFDLFGYLAQRKDAGKRRPAKFFYVCAPMAMNGDCRSVVYNFDAISTLFPEVYPVRLTEPTQSDLLFFYGLSSFDFLKSDIGRYVENAVKITEECWYFETSNSIFPNIIFYDGGLEGAGACSLSGMICYFKFGKNCNHVDKISYPDLIEIGASLVAPSLEDWERIYGVLKGLR